MTEINARQSLVAFFHARPFLRQDLVQVLREAEDATRIVQKFLLGRGSFSDLSSLCTTVETWSSIKERILTEYKMERAEDDPLADAQWASVKALMDRMSDLSDLAARISMALAQREDAIRIGDEMGEVFPLSEPSPAQLRDPRNPLGIIEWTIKPEYADLPLRTSTSLTSGRYSQQLMRLHDQLQSLLSDRDKLEQRLQVEYSKCFLPRAWLVC